MANTKPVPADIAAIERAAAPFGRSRLLPQECYTSPDVFTWEMEHFYERSWVCAGRADELARPGHQKALRVGNDGILLVRDEHNSIRAFFNVCRHRAHELLAPNECAHARQIRCPYHGWTFALDGSLKVAPRSGGDATEFCPGDFPLIPVRIEVWHGWVFVNLSDDAPPFAEWVGDLEALAAPYEPERLRPGRSRSYEAAVNWKLVHENYNECYHCPQIHPELCRVTPPDSGFNRHLSGAWVGGIMSLAPGASTMSLNGQSLAPPLRGISGEYLTQVEYIGLLPNLFLSFHPDYVMTHRLEPLAHDRTRIECQWLWAPEGFETPGFTPDYAFSFWDVVNRQDWVAIESVQRGISSRGYRPGALAPKEDGVYRFLYRIARGYLEGGISPAPLPVAVSPLA
jgi:Rieske 2Fe-2S family protein